jgi:hypothetical protein
MPTQENNLLKAELRHFTSSQEYFRNPLFRGFIYTEGVKYLAEKAQAYWLIDYILSNQLHQTLRGQRFQVWKIHVNHEDKAIITVDDGDGNKLVQFRIPFTDFPLIHFSLWLVDKTLLLPSEY